MIRNCLATFLITVLFPVLVFAQTNGTINSIIDNSEVKGALWSLSVLDADGNLLESINPDQLIIPASNQKLYTLGAVLYHLGEDFSYQTNIYSTGELKGGTLFGDVIIRGSGDPSIGGTFFEDDAYHAFRNFAQQLKEAGINRIEGDLIGYNGFFDEDIYPKGWDWDDLSFYYGVEIDALSFNNNAIDIEVLAEGSVGEKPTLTWFPEGLEGIQLINEQVIDEPGTKYDEYYRRRLGSNTIDLRSSLPQNYLETESLSIHNAAEFFLKSFKQYLSNEEGITFHELSDVITTRVKPDWTTLDVLATHESLPLSVLVEHAMRESDNFYTEMFLKTMAGLKESNPASFEEGITLVRDYLGQLDLDTTYVKMRDGSGLASGNLSTTSVIANYLSKMNSLDGYSTLYAGLPLAGIDGTLAHRFKATPMYKKIKAKSGYMAGVRTLSGYLTTKQGNEIIFSLATNHFVDKVKKVDAVHTTILNHLYETY